MRTALDILRATIFFAPFMICLCLVMGLALLAGPLVFDPVMARLEGLVKT